MPPGELLSDAVYLYPLLLTLSWLPLSWPAKVASPIRANSTTGLAVCASLHCVNPIFQYLNLVSLLAIPSSVMLGRFMSGSSRWLKTTRLLLLAVRRRCSLRPRQKVRFQTHLDTCVK